jgi:hypothetical protein
VPVGDYERQILARLEDEKRQESVQTPDHPDEKKAGVMRRLGEEQMRAALFQMSGTDLTVINGIRPETAAVIVSEIGLDFTRFPTEKHSELGAYFRNIARRQDAKTAIKSTARRMAILIYRLVRCGKAFIDLL